MSAAGGLRGGGAERRLLLHSATRLGARGLHARAGGERGCPRLCRLEEDWGLEGTVPGQLNSMRAHVKDSSALPTCR